MDPRTPLSQSQSLAFERLGSSHASEVFVVWSDFETVRLTNWVHTPTPSQCQERLEKVLTHYRDDTRHWGPFVIRGAGGVFLGLIGADVANESASEYEVWFVVRRDEWGKGIANGALAELLSLIDASGRVESLRATVVTDNLRSQKLLERHGFERRELLPRAHLVRGFEQDLFVYTRTSRSRCER